MNNLNTSNMENDNKSFVNMSGRIVTQEEIEREKCITMDMRRNHFAVRFLACLSGNHRNEHCDLGCGCEKV